MGRTKFRLGRKQEHLKVRLASGELEEAREFEHLDSTVWEDGSTDTKARGKREKE